MIQINTKEGDYQDCFLNSEAKFPCLLSAVGTGKTLCLLLKIWQYCEKYPGTSALIVRREFTDLRDSTMKDFSQYFEVTVGVDKNYKMPNGSLIMFRHADELNLLRNLNLGIVGIEQAEEFDDDTQFQMLRDRLRQQNGATVRPLCVIANANGMNWVWKSWVNGSQTVNEIDKATGQVQYINGEYDCLTANTFANERNLPPDFIADLKRKEIEAPNHYKQFVMNSFEEMSADDYVFNFAELIASKNKEYALRPGYGVKVAGFDIGRYGDDPSACVILQQLGALVWRVAHTETWGKTDLDATTGRILNLSNTHGVSENILDEDGIGGGPLDFITKGRKRNDFKGFRNIAYNRDQNKDFVNPRTKAAFFLKDYIARGYIILSDEKLIQEMMTIRYKYANDGRRVLVSKEEQRKHNIKSQNLFDALAMASTLCESVQDDQNRQYRPRQNDYASGWSPFAREDNFDPFKQLGIR